jgi:hypothetical protein
VRERVASARQHRQDAKTAPPAPPTPTTVPEQLRQLSELRHDGAISAEEYEAAKAHLLHTAS